MDLREKLEKFICEKATFEQLYYLIDEICGYSTDLYYLHVYNMEDFDEIIGLNMTPTTLACKIFYGNFNINDDYFAFDNIENLVSYNEYELIDEWKTYSDEIAEAILKWRDHITYDDEIEEILKEAEAEEAEI